MWPRLVSFQLIILMASSDTRRRRRRRGQQAENRVSLRLRLLVDVDWKLKVFGALSPSYLIVHQVLDDVWEGPCMTIFVLRVR